MYKCYSSLIRPLLLYGHPAFCNAPRYLIDNFEHFERRVFRVIGDTNFPSFCEVAEKICKKLMHTILMCQEHPLRELFLTCPSTYAIRKHNSLRRPFTRTKRFRDSFIKYCD